MVDVELSQGTNGIWHATVDVGGKVHKWSTKVKDREAAQQLADMRAKRIAAASIASQARWAKHYAEKGVPKGSKGTVSLPTPPERSGAPRASAPPDGSPSSQPRLLTSGPSPKPGAAAPAAAAPEAAPPSSSETVRAAEINERMRRRAGIADEEPEPVVEPDEVIPPPKRADPDDDELEDDDDELEDDDGDELDDDDGEDDPEAREFLVEAITEGALTGATRLGARIAKADRVPILGFKKTPRKPNEPDEKCVDLARKGLKKKLARLLTAEVKLTPGMAIGVGLAGIVLSMSWGAEELDSEGSAAAAGTGPRPAPPPPPPQREDEPDGAAVGGHPALAVVREGPPGGAPATGRFR